MVPVIYEAPMPQPVGIAITLSPFRRPTAECAPGRSQGRVPLSEQFPCADRGRLPRLPELPDARMLGNVAEFGNSNVFMAKDGVVYTPAPNGTFLNGITRQRVIELLHGAGVTVAETTLKYRRFPGRGRDFFDWQFRQGRADNPDRRPVAVARTVLRARAKAVLGLRLTPERQFSPGTAGKPSARSRMPDSVAPGRIASGSILR